MANKTVVNIGAIRTNEFDLPLVGSVEDNQIADPAYFLDMAGIPLVITSGKEGYVGLVVFSAVAAVTGPTIGYDDDGAGTNPVVVYQLPSLAAAGTIQLPVYLGAIPTGKHPYAQLVSEVVQTVAIHGVLRTAPT